MDISRSLIHYSLVHSEFVSSKDIITGLLPIFSPVIAKNNGYFFHPDTFVNDLEIMYGLKMHPYVAEEIAPKLEAKGLLKSTQVRNRITYVNSCDIEYESSNEQEIQFKKLISDFTDFAKKMLSSVSIEISNKEIEKGFYYRLARLDFIREINSKDVDKKEESVLDYAFARFVENSSERGKGYEKILEEAHSGAMLAEVVLNLKKPPKTEQSIEGIKILVDAPILIDLLGLADTETSRYTDDLLSEIKKSGGELITSDYYIQEAKELISNSLRSYGNNRQYLSSLDKFLLLNRLNKTKAESILRNIEEELKIKSVNFSPAVSYHGQNSTSQRAKELEEGLYSALGDYQNEKAKDRDAKSAALVVIVNQYKAIYNINDAKIFFLTKNSRITDNINSYLKRKRLILEGSMSPVITDRKLATLMWVMNGGVGKNLLSSELLANCHRAIKSKLSILQNAKEVLLDITKSSEEDINRIEGIIKNQRAAFCLLDKVGGDIELIKNKDSKSLIDEIIEEIKIEESTRSNEKLQQVIEEIESNNAEVTAKINTEHETEKELLQETSNSRIEILENKILKLDALKNELIDAKNAKDNELQEASNIIARFKFEKEEDNLRILNQADFISGLFEKTINISFIVVVFFIVQNLVSLDSLSDYDFGIIVIKMSYLEKSIPFISSALALLLTWKIPDYTIGLISKVAKTKVEAFILNLRGFKGKSEHKIKDVINSNDLMTANKTSRKPENKIKES
ncbi:hypothetical protein [Parendozoicomonas sp. Alg238-R29]|uniref:hypothetical protein n=1 Tax=Parendozoicomonas sp. Alg238-R29 TaxID=2993446 RepID=UPI00248EB58D|nr:hypothetical protein [Parendozoicomonas sp. Alg238-R29]